MLLFIFPIILSNALQTLYTTADQLIVGQFSGDPNALAAIGSTSYISSLIINFVIGINAGCGVVVAQAVGSKDNDRIEKSTHNVFILSTIVSLIMTVVAFATAAPLLRLLGTKEELFDSALLYVRIIFAGIPASALYNASAAIIRATGDSATPLRVATVSGLLNVLLNLVFVLGFNASVAGVAAATIISHYFSAATCIYHLYRQKGEAYAFSPKKLIPDKRLLLHMLRLGIPAGLQSICLNIANMASAAATNSFDGTVYVSAKSIATDIDNLTATVATGFLPATMNAVGQNVGAKKPERVKKVFFYGLLQSAVIMFVLSSTLNIFVGDIAKLYIEADDPDILAKIEAVVAWSGVILPLQFLNGTHNSSIGALRGLGYSILPLTLNLIGAVGTRLAWIYFVFNPLPTRELGDFRTLAVMYPISVAVTTVLLSVASIIALVKMKKKQEQEAISEENSDESADLAASKS